MNKKLIPKLRFPQFTGEWIFKNAGDIFESVSDRNHSGDLDLLAATQDKGIVKRIELDLKINSSEQGILNYKIVNPGNFVISLRSFQGGIEYSNIKGLVSPAYTVLKSVVPISDYFYKIFLKKESFISSLDSAVIGIRDGKQISYSVFSKLKLPYPKPEEQQKIADFLSVIDKKLENLKAKKEKLEKYKKGVMQKIFSQEIRFKNENGKDFEEWEEKRLDNIGESYNGLSGKSGDDFGKGEKYITYKQIFDKSRIDVNKCEFVNIFEGESQNRANYGDIFFTVSSETPNEIGFASVLLDNVPNLYLNSFCFGYRPNSLKDLEPNYARFFFRSHIYRKDVIKLAQGSTRYNLSKTNFMKLKFLFPSYDEQIKIGFFLSKLDEKIEKEAKIIEKTQEFKKGLLQLMFI